MTSIVITTRFHEAWVPADDLRRYCPVVPPGDPPAAWAGHPLLKALLVESVYVAPDFRRRGHLTRFLAWAAADPRYDLVIVQGVANKHLRAALKRWGWAHDPGVQDYYLPATAAAKAAVAALPRSRKEAAVAAANRP